MLNTLFFRVKLLLLVFLLTMGLTTPTYADDSDVLPTELQKLMKRFHVAKKNSGILIMRLDNNEVLASVNRTTAFNPASVIKIVTAAAAIDTHSPNYTWQTRIAIDGVVKNNTLNGNLYLIGGGDPYITAEKFEYIIRSLYRHGIKTINGNLIIDDSYYQLPFHSPEEFDGAEFRTYNVGANAMLVNFKSLEVVLTNDGKNVIAYTVPPNDQFILNNNIKPGNGQCRSWRRNLNERYYVEENSITLKLSGGYPFRCKKQSLRLAALKHVDYIGGYFTAIWREMGGHFNGVYQQGKTPETATVIDSHESQTLSQVTTLMNKYSNNVIARHLFLSLADNAQTRSIENAREAMQQWLKKHTIDNQTVIDNGSGLSRLTRITPKNMGRALKLVWQHPYREEIIASFPILGLDGTLKKRPSEGISKGMARFKTGSLVNSKAIAGFFRDKKNNPYLLVIFNKNSSTRNAKSFQNAVLKWLYQKT